MINKIFWKLVALILSRPWIVNWLINRALRTPYTHIPPQSGEYMERYWLFNPYPSAAERDKREAQGLPRNDPHRFPISIRLHKINREDLDRHHHDHPWNARTILLRGMYIEERLERRSVPLGDFELIPVTHVRKAGDTATINFNEYHKIEFVSSEGVWTMFITYEFMGTWGFLVDGKKVPYKEYLK